MFWTAIVWGLGVSIGGSVGLMSFFVMYHFFKVWVNDESLKSLRNFQKQQMEALEKRNELTVQSIEQLVGIKIGLDKLVEAHCEDQRK